MNTSIVVFIIVGLLLIPTGIVLLLISDAITEVTIDYTFCKNDKNETCSEVIEENDKPCMCNLNFTVNKTIQGPVYIYYGLTNFYLNHRLYLKSRDSNQLLGEISNSVSSYCHPLTYDPDGKPYFPCGTVANSMFSDTISLKSYKYGDIPVLKTGLTWSLFKKNMYRNPSTLIALNETSKPKNWSKNICELDPENPDNNCLENEHFIMWMNGASLPWFRKMLQRIDHTTQYLREGLPTGQYHFEVNYTYKTVKFNGTKMVILANTGLIGAKNPFLGLLYVNTGIFCILFSIYLYFTIYYRPPKSLLLVTVTVMIYATFMYFLIYRDINMDYE